MYIEPRVDMPRRGLSTSAHAVDKAAPCPPYAAVEAR